MELIRKFTITFSALALWILSAIIFDGSGVLLGIAIGALLFEMDIAQGLAEKIRKLVKLD